MRNNLSNTSKKDKKISEKICSTTTISVLSILISSMSLIISYQSKQINEFSAPLSYNVEQVISNCESESYKTFYTEVEFSVKSGAIGNIYTIDYHDGKIQNVEKLQGGTITAHSTKSQRTVSYEIEYDKRQNTDEFMIVRFLLVEGRDKSLNLGMIKYHINSKKENIDVRYYSATDLKIALIDPLEAQYSRALNDFDTLLKYFNIS